MPAPLSIIIPTLHAEAGIGPTLACLAEALTDGLIREVILSDGGSEHMEAIAEEAGATFLTGSPGRGGQLRRGADAAKGDWLLFLHADTLLAPGWAAAITAHIAEHSGKAAYFHLRFDASGPAPTIVSRWANLRSRLFGLPYGDQGLLISRALHERIGGYQDIPLMEDVALARALKGQLRPLGHIATTSAARYQAQGWLKRGSRNLWLLTLYFAGRSPERLAEIYRRGRDKV